MYKMTRIQTYVFIDLETTGLPLEEYNKTRITELSMVAVKRQHLLDTRPGAVPRVQHKLTLCFNPLRRVADDGTRITGLCNDLLEFEPQFNKQIYTMIDTFLNVLSQPVCLVAQNGLYFDYPILKNHLTKLNVEFTCDLLCADCYYAFYHILEKQKLLNCQSANKCSNGELNTKAVEKMEGSQVESSSKGTIILSTPYNRQSVDQPSASKTKCDEIDYYTSNIEMQAINETTPKAMKLTNSRKSEMVSKVRKRLFPWGDGPKSTQSYKLKNIYERVLNKQAVDAHRAENDCMLALEVSVALSNQFVEWVDENHSKFSEVVPMTTGVPIR